MADVFERDEDGNVTNPPVIPEHEASVLAAANASDQSALDKAQENYNKAREELIAEIEKDAPKQEDSPSSDPGNDWPQTEEEFTARQAREKAAWDAEHAKSGPVPSGAPQDPSPAPVEASPAPDAPSDSTPSDSEVK